MADFGGTDNVVATQSLTQSAQEKLRQLQDSSSGELSTDLKSRP